MQCLSSRRWRALIALCLLAPWTAADVTAQDAATEPAPLEPPVPLVVFNVASADRVLSEVTYMFEAAGREDMNDIVTGLLGNLGDLKGLDRTRPLGVMLFLEPGFPPQPQPVGFVPVKDIDELLETLSIGPVRAEKVEGEDGRYQLVPKNNPRPGREMLAVLRDGYLFITNSEGELLLDADLPNPVEITQPLVNRYDVAVSVNMQSVPEAMKTILLDFVRAQAEADLQQRDDEPDSAYQMRRAGGESNLRIFEQILTQTDELLLGLDASRDRKSVVVEALIHATPDSAYAKYLKDLGGQPSHFTALLSDASPLTLSVSWKMDEREKALLTEAIGSVQKQMISQLEIDSPLEQPINDLAAALTETAAAGHLDFFLQFRGEPPEGFVLLGGAKVARGRAIGSAMQEIFQQLQQTDENLESVQLNAEVHQGVPFHKIVMDEVRPQDERLYGGKPGIYVGAGANTVWFAIGGDGAMTELKQAMDTVVQSPAASRGPSSGAPFQLVANLSQWIDKLGNPEEDDRGRELARDAFSQGADMLRFDIRPTETGARLHIQLDEGFLKLLGLAISRRYDRSQL